MAERTALGRPWVESRLIFADAAWGRLGVAEHGFSHPTARWLKTDFRRCGRGKIGCGQTNCTRLIARRIKADFRRCGPGKVGCGQARIQPPDRVLREGRFSQMRQGGGWVWPNDLQSVGPGSNRG